ncbi:MAG: AtpZ/AtpI family protein [Planctomycetota bacterium]|jgi:F0F1-type ATP synthase assembly protein I
MAAAERTRPRESAQEIRIGWQMAGLGFQVASEVLAGAALGWLFDLWRGTEPTGMLVGSLIGISVGLFTLISKSLQLNRQLDEIARRRRAEKPSRPSTPEAKAGDEQDDPDDWEDRWAKKWNDDDDHEPEQ